MKVIACILLVASVAYANMVDENDNSYEIRQGQMEMPDSVEDGAQMRTCIDDSKSCKIGQTCCRKCSRCTCDIRLKNCKCVDRTEFLKHLGKC
uniref:U41-Austrotoxin-Ht1a_1 n=1 Tax=Hickmania troglodytes TaxID=489260 RepID=A0A482Z9C7_9ARAC